MNVFEFEVLIERIGTSHEVLVGQGVLPDQTLTEIYEGRDRLELELEPGIELEFWRETRRFETLFVTLIRTIPSMSKYEGELPISYMLEMTQSDVHAVFGEPMASKGPIKMPVPIGMTGGWDSYPLDPELYPGKKVVFQYAQDMRVKTLVFTLIDKGHR
ncbi:DUF6392 family protein [Pseudomonas hefeiensis]|uniref:DUF6392 family protein n=1 Tax=Pseudomonas hefeiensis TaxID=2738125 RepID=A0ABY9GHS3_9PSED|nr:MULTISPECIES: DUF6392 family protein [unclassified Pseudomonas]WLH15149.1 DUF6392 family protein [Pseudomonas sp. FP205]WLH98195.1 DUF6392 family protein [Pseudomonas sp. FP53]WLI42471.1 DUF6392 family protein [Pseudomonas sp. FP821]